MHASTGNPDHDKDALHILPLSMLPLETPGLYKARLIKNWHLDGVVELFCDSDTGSGQIPPNSLSRVFQLDDENWHDLEMITALAQLPSFDVYSLRVGLRKLGIEVEDHASLQLSDEKKNELSGYMRDFTKPLVTAIFGDEEKEIKDLNDFTKVLNNPDQGVAWRNLESMSRALNIEVKLIPDFLQNYGDVYLSLAYYQNCLDQNRPYLAEFFASIEQIRNDYNLKRDNGVINACTLVERNLRRIVKQIESVLAVFRARTSDMWEHISGEEFKKIEAMVASYQANIGGALCAITVKMKAWEQTFSFGDSGRLAQRADFLRSQILPGVSSIEDILAAT